MCGTGWHQTNARPTPIASPQTSSSLPRSGRSSQLPKGTAEPAWKHSPPSRGIAPGIVVGRLQHEKIIPYSRLNDLRVQLEYAADG